MGLELLQPQPVIGLQLQLEPRLMLVFMLTAQRSIVVTLQFEQQPLQQVPQQVHQLVLRLEPLQLELAWQLSF